jgi:hypothetical protein
MRRRLRERRRVREGLLLDLGAIVYELHRQGKRAPELLQQKAAELTDIDDEVRELEDALAGVEPEEEADELEEAEELEPAEDEPEIAEPVLAEPEEPRA